MSKILEALRQPFEEKQVKYKVQSEKGDWSTFVCYVDARDVIERLNKVVGLDWKDEYRREGNALICRLSILHNGQWISREDTGTESNMDAQKGEMSDALKRAAVKFGIGLHLYSNPMIRVKNNATRGGKPCAAGFDGGRIYDATEFCRKLIAQNANKDQIWFDSEKNKQKQPQQPAQKKHFTQTIPPPSLSEDGGAFAPLITPPEPEKPKSNAGNRDLMNRIYRDLKIGSKEQKILVAKLLGSSAFEEDRDTFVQGLNKSKSPKEYSEAIDMIKEELAFRKDQAKQLDNRP